MIINKDHPLRKFSELDDFSYVMDEVTEKYCLDNGRLSNNPIMMFKYLFLKSYYELSDADLVARSYTDMAFKFFLGLSPEAEVINLSSLTKFRKLRLQDETLLDKLITHTLQIAKENNIQLSKAIIVDSTHTESRYNSKSIRTVLIEKAKELRKSVYSLDESYTTKMPKKKEKTGLIEDIT